MNTKQRNTKSHYKKRTYKKRPKYDIPKIKSAIKNNIKAFSYFLYKCSLPVAYILYSLTFGIIAITNGDKNNIICFVLACISLSFELVYSVPVFYKEERDQNYVQLIILLFIALCALIIGIIIDPEIRGRISNLVASILIIITAVKNLKTSFN